MHTGAASRYKIESVVRACRILTSFRSEHETLRLQDLATRAELPPSTTLRLLRTLEQCGFLTQVAPGRYRALLARPAARKYRIGFVVDSAGRPFRQEVSLGLQYAAARYGVDLICLDHSADRRLAIRDADSLVSNGVDLVIDFQTGYDLAGLVAAKYMQAGIPLIAIDTPHPGATFFGVNNYVAGTDGGRWLGGWVRRNWRGRVDRVVTSYATAEGVTAARVRGALEGLRDVLGAGAGLRVEQLGAPNNLESTFHSVQRWLSAVTGGRTLFIMPSDPAVMGTLTALEEAGAKIPAAVFGFGGNQETRAMLRTRFSRLVGCVGFRPESYGDGLVRTAIRILEGQPTPPAVFVEHTLIDAANVDLLYPNDRASDFSLAVLSETEPPNLSVGSA